MRQALIGLQGYGISSAYAAKIYKEYGADTSRTCAATRTALPRTSVA